MCRFETVSNSHESSHCTAALCVLSVAMVGNHSLAIFNLTCLWLVFLGGFETRVAVPLIAQSHCIPIPGHLDSQKISFLPAVLVAVIVLCVCMFFCGSRNWPGSLGGCLWRQTSQLWWCWWWRRGGWGSYSPTEEALSEMRFLHYKMSLHKGGGLRRQLGYGSGRQ